MKKNYTFSAILFLILLFVEASFAAPLKPFRLHNPSAKQLTNMTIKLAKGMEVSVAEYVQATSFKAQKGFNKAFQRNFARKYLVRPPRYDENVQGLADRLKVERVLELEFKDPCASGIPAEISFCFDKTGATVPKELKLELEKIRIKLKAESKKKNSKMSPRSLKRLLSLSDEDLLDYILNRASKKKTITHTSYVPYLAYKKKTGKLVDLSNIKARLPVKNIFDNSPPMQANLPLRQTKPYVQRKQFVRFDRDSNVVKNIVFGTTFYRNYGDTIEKEFAEETIITDRYYARFSYHLRFGVGLRFPFKINANSRVTHMHQAGRKMLVKYPAEKLCNKVTKQQDAALCVGRSEVNISATPIDGNANFYSQAGVPANDIVGGKEFVFEVDAGCGFYASIPGKNARYNCPEVGFVGSKNFKPQIGSGRKDLMDYELPDSFGIGFDYGLAYAKLVPVIGLQGAKGRILFDISPYRSEVLPLRELSLGSGSHRITVAEKVNSGRQDWGFNLSNPQYKVNALIVPKIRLKLGINLIAYKWNDAYTFAIEPMRLDLGRYTFHEHDGVPNRFQFVVGTRQE